MFRTRFFSIFIALIIIETSWAEFQVNSYTASEQTTPAIAGDAQGNFVIVWASKNQDGDWRGIYGQRFDSYGRRIGNEFQINVTTAGNQKDPDVAMNAAGDFVVVWHGPDGSDEGIYGRKYAADGTPLTEEFLVNTYTVSRQISPSVAMNDSGAFVIVWEEWYGFDIYNGVWRISCRLYDASGVPLGPQFVVNESVVGVHGNIACVAMDETGDFVVAWYRYDQDVIKRYLRMRRYDADGTPKGNEVDLCGENDDGFVSSIAINRSGNFIIAWEIFANIYAQRFDDNGNKVGIEFMVNTTVSGSRFNPDVAMNDDGKFIIVWWGNGDEYDIFGRCYGPNGLPESEEFRLNSYIAGEQEYPSVLIQPWGRFIAAWQSEGQDGSEIGVFARFEPETFAGDFTGDGIVDFYDIAVLASRWLQNEPVLDIIPSGTGDDTVNFLDFAGLSADWLQMQPWCTPLADINGDGIVNFWDFAILTGQWFQEPGEPSADIAPFPAGDDIVNMLDLKLLAEQWLKDGPSYIP